MNKIAIIIPYFGKWPEWIDLYFYSCARNQYIDWLFYTDCTIPVKHNSNLQFHSVTFSGYCKLVSEKLGIDFQPDNPYKLCGLKPFYGFIHNELIKDYKFWGFGDVDVIWGDISHYYSEKLLSDYDVLSTHADRLSGHLTILKNTKKYTEFCFEIEDWKLKLQDARNIALDEQEFSWLIYPTSRFITKFYSKIIRKLFNWRDAWVLYYSIVMPVFNLVNAIDYRRLYFKEQHTTPILANDGRSFKYDSDTWYYKDGRVINAKTGKEHIYFHFMIYKKNGFRSDHFWKDNFYNLPLDYQYDKGVLIDKTGFHEC
jgi:hypothetical protein